MFTPLGQRRERDRGLSFTDTPKDGVGLNDLTFLTLLFTSVCSQPRLTNCFHLFSAPMADDPLAEISALGLPSADYLSAPRPGTALPVPPPPPVSVAASLAHLASSMAPLAPPSPAVSNTPGRAAATAMASLLEKARVLTSERDEMRAKVDVLQAQVDKVQTSLDDQSAQLVTEVAAAQAIAAKEVKATLASTGAQHLALHKELDFVKDLAQAAETEKRAVQAQVMAMEKQIAGMRYDAESRIYELDARAKGAAQSEAVAQARTNELTSELESLMRKFDESAVEKKRMEDALRAVLAMNESLISRISVVDGPRRTSSADATVAALLERAEVAQQPHRSVQQAGRTSADGRRVPMAAERRRPVLGNPR